MVAPDYGIDISCAVDIDPMFRLVSGIEIVRQAAVRRLQSRTGSLFLDPRYGLDVRTLVGSSTVKTGVATASFVAGQIRTQLLADERIDSVRIDSAVYDEARRGVAARFTVTTADGPFGLVLTLTASAVDVIVQGA